MTPKFGILGFGKMGQAIWKGIQKKDLIKTEHVSICETSSQTHPLIQQLLGTAPVSLQELIETSNICLVCIKPQHIKELLNEIKSFNYKQTKFISILAGTPISCFQDYLGTSTEIIRVMPNTPTLVNEGMSVLSKSNTVSDAFMSFCVHLFEGIGKVDIVDEQCLDIVTGISGSGPAFFYHIARSMALTGEEKGLSQEQSLRLVAQTMIGAGKMLLESGSSPEDLIKAVSSPGGTTLAGLDVLYKSSVDKDLKQVILAAYKRSKELSE